MPFGEEFKGKRNSQVRGLEAHSPNFLTDGAGHSLQLFGLKLLQQESSIRLKQNVFISPLSIFLALAMAENGAAGETKAAMRKVLAIPADASEKEVNGCAASLMTLLRSHGEAELAIANALWVDVRSTIEPKFVELCQEIYGATARTLDLNQPSSATIINEWVSEKTRGKIPRIVSPDSLAHAIAILTNAVYFKGKFRIPFRRKATEPKPFYLVDGKKKVVQMMRGYHLPDSYRNGREFEAAVLRYKDSGIALYLLLPAKGTSPEQVVTEDSMREMLLAKESCELDLSMPRFTIDFTCHLKELLTRQGMGIAFQAKGADFSALGSPLFYLDEVIHKTHLEVDEEGTVAAAATAIPAPLSEAMPARVEIKTLVFDRPFAVMLRDTLTGAIIFVGVIYEP